MGCSTVENIRIQATDNSPEVDFDFEANAFALRGMSFMEDVSSFYSPLHDSLDAHFDGLVDASVRFEFALAYFNSSSARVILRMLMRLDELAEQNEAVHIVWHAEDEDLAEEGEEMGEDLENATFEIVISDT